VSDGLLVWGARIVLLALVAFAVLLVVVWRRSYRRRHPPNVFPHGDDDVVPLPSHPWSPPSPWPAPDPDDRRPE
jgi:hypothetical protein